MMENVYVAYDLLIKAAIRISIFLAQQIINYTTHCKGIVSVILTVTLALLTTKLYRAASRYFS